MLLLSLSLVSCQQNNEEVEVKLKIKTIGHTTVEHYITNSSALDILKKDHEVDGKGFIKCIDDVCSNQNYVWLFYINEEKTLYSASIYYPKENDTIGFYYSQIDILSTLKGGDSCQSFGMMSLLSL